MPILGGYTSTSYMNILHNQAMICIIKVSYWGAFPNSARLFCIYIIVALHIFPNFDFFSRPYVKGADCSAPLCKTFEAHRRYRMLARRARDCLDNSHISSSRERRSSMSAA